MTCLDAVDASPCRVIVVDGPELRLVVVAADDFMPMSQIAAHVLDLFGGRLPTSCRGRGADSGRCRSAS